MPHNFDEIINRENTDAIKLEKCKLLFGTENVLPLWVADMDFRTPDFVLNAIQKRLEHPVLGYTTTPADFFELFAAWTQKLHDWQIKTEWTGFIPGIVPGLAFTVQCFTKPGEEVIVQPPVYHPFMNVVNNNGRDLVYNPLQEVKGKFEMDFDDLRSKITDKTRMLILCNPHNPGGKVWTLETLRKLDEICAKHKILVVSDEIHADMVLPGDPRIKHIPFAKVSQTAADNSVTFMAPSKTFNMPGLKTSFYVIPNSKLYQQFTSYLEASEVKSGNIFAYAATAACYAEGNHWRKAMLRYVQENVDYVIDFLNEHIPQIRPMRPEASFLMWLDCKALGMEPDELHHFFVQKAGLGLNQGTIFGPGGEYHMRLNVACPKVILEQAMTQLKNALSVQ
jgi:cystathionine beta-lyase